MPTHREHREKHRASFAAHGPISRSWLIPARSKRFGLRPVLRPVCDFPATAAISALHCLTVKRRLRATPRIPAALDEIARLLAQSRAKAHLVGDALREALIDAPLPLREAGAASHGDRAERFTLLTDASPVTIVAHFATAVPTARGGACFRLGTGGDGPVDLCPLPAGRSLEDHLRARDFTQFAMAARLGPEARRMDRPVFDPMGGRADLEAGVLRAIGAPEKMLRADPVRGLRAVRLVACEGDALDPALREAIVDLPGELLARCSPHRLRRELDGLLLSERVGEGLRLLESLGLDAALAEDIAPDAAARAAAQPPRLHLRLAAWLLGARAGRALRRLRYSPHIAGPVLAFVASHPIDRTRAWQRPSSLRKMAARLDTDTRSALIALRRRELASEPDEAATRSLDQLERAFEALDREAEGAPAPRLAVDGRCLISTLGLSPGPQLGALLRHLNAAILADPECNTQDALLELARRWLERAPAGGSGEADRD